MPPSMGSIFGMMFGDAQTEKQRSSTISDAVWGYTDRDAAEIDKQGRRGNLEVPSAEQRIIDFFVVFRIGIFLSQFLITALPSLEFFPLMLFHFH